MAEIRDYRLTGAEANMAVEKGLAEANWYTSPISREDMRKLMIRKNGPAIRDTLIWFGLIGGSAFLTVLLWGTWWFLLPYIVYSALYASTSDSRWHESSHGTAFKTDWLNNVLYEISSFMVLRQSTVWRWSHTRHHSDTLVRGRDPEIAVPRPPSFWRIFLTLFALPGAKAEFKRMFIHASGNIDKEVATFLPSSENKKVIWKARIYLMIFIAVIFLSLYYSTLLPLMFIGLPTLFGSWLMPVYGMTQHSGLEENVLDHRINCRTVYMNRIHRFLYWNMNYHLEHHMFPMVPYHALPRLHKLVKDDCVTPNRSLLNAWKEIIPALRKQAKDTSYYIKRKLPGQGIQQKEHQVKFVASKQNANDKGWVKICNADQLAKNDVIRFDCDAETYAIYRTANNELYATEGICTHGSTHLAEGLVIEDQIECPKHNGRFNIKDGSVQRQPVCVALSTFKVYEQDNILYFDPESGSKKKEPSYECKVISNHNVATFIKELVLEPLNSDEFLTYSPGDYIHLEIPQHQTKFDTISIDKPYHKLWKSEQIFDFYAFNHTNTHRNYSFASNPETDKQIIFNIRVALPPEGKNCNAGLGSSYVFNLKEGDRVKISGPYGDFHIKDSDAEMIYVGGGAGMAPLRSHISYLFDTLKTHRKVSFWYGARSLNELFYEEYFRELASKHENFSFHVALSEALPDDNWNSHTGFIHEVLDRNYLINDSNRKNKEFYLCGPPAMIGAMQKTLESYKVPEENILFDEF